MEECSSMFGISRASIGNYFKKMEVPVRKQLEPSRKEKLANIKSYNFTPKEWLEERDGKAHRSEPGAPSLPKRRIIQRDD